MAENKGVATKPGQLVQFAGIQLTAEQFRTIEHTIAPGLDMNEMELFFFECKRRGVHPMDRLIFPIKRNDNSEGGAGQKKLTFQCSIDYFRAASEDTGKYLGQEPVEFGPDIPLSKASPKTGAGHDDLMVPEYATVTLLRKNENGDVMRVSATAYWNEYYPGEKMGFMWRKMPKGQLAKCAEALAHRKAFPRELGGLYANEEVERVDSDVPFAKSSTVREAQRSSAGELPQGAPPRMPNPGPPAGAPAEGSLPGFAVSLPSDIEALSDAHRKLFIEAMTQAQGDVDVAFTLIKKHSEFKGKSGAMQSISIFEMGKATEAWCNATLNKLRSQK